MDCSLQLDIVNALTPDQRDPIRRAIDWDTVSAPLSAVCRHPLAGHALAAWEPSSAPRDLAPPDPARCGLAPQKHQTPQGHGLAPWEKHNNEFRAGFKPSSGTFGGQGESE